MRTVLRLWLLTSLLLLGACSVNPVTGKKEVILISAAQEVAIGKQQYQPSQQSQGGRYVVDPDLSVYVNSIGQELAAVSQRPKLPYEFVVLNNDVPNAWALPGGKIAINRGLLIHLEDESQLAAVLSHEIVHAAARHGAQKMTQGMILTTGTQIIGQASSNSEYGEWIATGAGIGAAAWQSRYGRDQELDSDRYGMDIMVKAGYSLQGAVELQQTFVKLSEGRNQDWLSGLFASHPPSQERVAANQRRAARLSGDSTTSGKRNHERFQRAIAQIKRDQKAYDANQQAVTALKNKDLTKALALSNEAIKLQKNESLFWETKAYVLNQQGSKQQALNAFNQAIQTNPEYFSPYLGRGSLQMNLKNYSSAERDLLASKKILDTQPANFMLGEVSMQLGKEQSAINYYQQVAQSGGELGQTATQRLQQLGAIDTAN